MKRLFIAAISLLWAALAMAQQPLPIDPAVKIGKLDNGLTYYIRQHKEPAGQANFYIAQKVGSVLEEESQRGLAHFLEHMCFNGTKNFPGNGVIKYCERIGVQFGGDLNAYTSIDETVYNIDNVPVEKFPSAVDSCLLILHDWANDLLLKGEDIDQERGVIHEEWRQRSGAMIRMYEKVLPKIYPGNRYGERLPIGLMSVVDNFEHQVLRDYYHKWYRPDLQGIIVVGDINPDEVEAKIKSIFSPIAMPENPAQRVYFPIEDNEKPIIVNASDKEQQTGMSYIMLKHDIFPVEMRSDVQYLVYKYAQNAAQIMLNARIAELSQKADAPFSGAQVSDGDYLISKTKGALTGVAIYAEEKMTSALTALYREMLRAIRNGFTASEYDRAKADILSQVETQYNQREKRKSASLCREYVRHFIDNEPIPGIETEYAIMQQVTKAIPVEVINQIFQSLATDKNLVVASFLPEKEGVVYPSEAEIEAALAAVAAENIEPYVEVVSNEPLIKVMPKAGKVISKKDDKFSYKKLVLSNGAQVYMRQTDFNKDEIIMHAYSMGGRSLYPASEYPSLKVLEEVMTVGGLGEFSATELRKQLSGKKVSFNASIGNHSEELSGKSTPKDLETLMQLVYLGFTSRRMDDEAFAAWKTRTVAYAKNLELEPMYEFKNKMYETLFTDADALKDITAAQVEAIDYAHVMEIAKQRFASPSDFTFVFTGNFDEQVLTSLLEQYIASIPAVKAEKCNPKKFNFKTGRQNVLFDQPMQTPMATNLFADYITLPYTLKNSLILDMTSSALSTVLLEEIREKEGGTYGIGAYGRMGDTPHQGAFMQIVYQTDPAKFEKLNEKIRTIVNDFAKTGARAEDLAKNKELYVKRFKEAQRENSFWENAILEWAKIKADVVTGYEQTLQAITEKDTADFLAAMLKAGNHAEVIMRGVEKK